MGQLSDAIYGDAILSLLRSGSNESDHRLPRAPARRPQVKTWTAGYHYNAELAELAYAQKGTAAHAESTSDECDALARPCCYERAAESSSLCGWPKRR